MEHNGKILHFGRQSESKVGRKPRYSDEIVMAVIDMRLIKGMTWVSIIAWLQSKVDDGTIKSVPKRRTVYQWVKQYCEQTGAAPYCLNPTEEQKKTFGDRIKSLKAISYRPNARVRKFLQSGDKKNVSATINTIVEWYIDQLINQKLYKES